MPHLRIKPIALALTTFLIITYLLCVLFGLILTSQWHQLGQMLEMLLPGFKWLSIGSFLMGLFWTIVYGLYTAVLFVFLYNYFSRKTRQQSEEYSYRWY